jgi:uroporphyrinogen-III synthase
MGLESVTLPLFEVEPVEWRAPDPAGFDGLLLTSANALRHGGAQLDALRELPVYAVGERTADAARDAGFDIVAVGDSDVERLLSSIPAKLRLLHLAGEDRREPAASQAVAGLAVYRSKPIQNPNVDGIAGSVALVHSPRAGRRFAELAEDRASIAIVAISPAAAEAVGAGWETVEAAGRPTDEAVLALAASLCNKPAPQ